MSLDKGTPENCVFVCLCARLSLSLSLKTTTTMTATPEIAIIEPNTLTCIGLQTLIEEMMPFATVRSFNSFEQFIHDTPDMYFHYFISSQTLLEHNAFFIERKHKTIVLTNGITGTTQLSDFHSLNIYQSKENMVRSLLRLQQSAHSQGKNLPDEIKKEWQNNASITHKDPNGLSAREIEVLIEIVKGLSNKAIADKLNIGVTTVISHRKNLMEKLHIHTVSGLTIYAVINGYIEADRI